MAIKDIIDCKLITTWKKNNAKNLDVRKFIPFDQIRIKEDFQKLNENADLQATINARSFRTLTAGEKKDFFRSHSRNIVVGENADGTYSLLTGLISYETLKKVYVGRAYANEKFLQEFRLTASDEDVKKKTAEVKERLDASKNILAYVTNYENREQFIYGIRSQYDILFSATLDYILVPEYKESWNDEIVDEISRLKKETQYSPILNGIINNETITLLDEKSEFCFWAIKKAGREKARIQLKKLKAEETITSSETDTIDNASVSYDDSFFEIDF